MKDHKKLAEEGIQKHFTAIDTETVHLYCDAWPDCEKECDKDAKCVELQNAAKQCYRLELEGIIAANPTKINAAETYHNFGNVLNKKTVMDCNKEYYEKILEELDKL